jgi:hypothetical protein
MASWRIGPDCFMARHAIGISLWLWILTALSVVVWAMQ